MLKVLESRVVLKGQFLKKTMKKEVKAACTFSAEFFALTTQTEKLQEKNTHTKKRNQSQQPVQSSATVVQSTERRRR